jgi:hypothetical protein
VGAGVGVGVVVGVVENVDGREIEEGCTMSRRPPTGDTIGGVP